MIVTDIIDFSKKQCKIMIDDEFAFVLYKGELHLYGIRQGEKIEEAVYDRIVGEVLTKRAKLRAMNLLKTRAYTEKKLREKLEAGKYPASCVEQAVAYVKSFGYVDDRRYASDYLFYHGKNLNGRQVYIKLREKGVAEETIREVYEEFCDSGEAVSDDELIRNYLDKKKYVPSDDEAAAEKKNKIIRALMQRGFHYDRIAAVLQSYGKNDEEFVKIQDWIG